MMPEIINRLRHDKRIRRILKFGLVGVSGLFVNSAALWLFHDLAGLTLFLASPLAIAAAIFTNFILNDQWTWRENQSSRHFSFAHRLARYYLSAALGALINYASLITLTHFAGMNFLVSNLIGIFGGMFFNFILSEMWVFKDSASE